MQGRRTRRQLERQLRLHVPDVRVIYVDPKTAAPLESEIRSAIKSADKVVVAIYMVPTSGATRKEGATAANSISLAAAPAALLNYILESAREKTLVVSFGSPYIAADFPQIENYVCAYSDVPTAESAAVKALFGEIAIHGHLPVTITGFAYRGGGIQRPMITP